jgi:hypothetical protein
VRHRLIGGRKALRTFRIYLDVFGLSSVSDSVVAGVLLGDGDKDGVGAGRVFDSWRTRKRRIASALIPSASVSGEWESIYGVFLSEGGFNVSESCSRGVGIALSEVGFDLSGSFPPKLIPNFAKG